VASAKKPVPRQSIAFGPQSVVLEKGLLAALATLLGGLRPDAAGLAARRRGGGAGHAADRVAARVERPNASPARPRRGRGALRGAVSRPHRAADRRGERARLARGARSDADAASGLRLLPRLGYAIVDARLERDREARLWRCFVAERDGRRLRVCERIEEAHGLAFTDASSWFWAAQLGRSSGPWQAITVADAAREHAVKTVDSATRDASLAAPQRARDRALVRAVALVFVALLAIGRRRRRGACSPPRSTPCVPRPATGRCGRRSVRSACR
jgi:hypothetical protein